MIRSDQPPTWEAVSITRVLGTLREWKYPVSLRPPFPWGRRRPRHQLPRDTRREGRLLGSSRFRRPCRMGTRDARACGRPFQVARRRDVPWVRSRLRRPATAPRDRRGVTAAADERRKLESQRQGVALLGASSATPCRYNARPAVRTGRLSLTAQGHIYYRLKTPDRDGTARVVFEPVDKIVGNNF